MSTRAEDQSERAHGTWQLCVLESGEDPITVDRVRRALRMKRGEREVLARKLPGPVRRGARTDLEPLLERLKTAGLRAEIARRE